MLQVLVFVFVLALIYALKAVSVAKQHDQIIENSTAFSYLHVRSLDEVMAHAEKTQAELEALTPQSAVDAPVVSRRVTA